MEAVMTFSIEPARSSPGIRRPKTSAAEPLDDVEGSAAAEPSNLPVPVGRARTIPPRTSIASTATIEAQILGERRGLRAGASVIEEAKVTYNRTEWSGSQDRRTPKGWTAKTEI
jgi:hypothetical protein